VREAITGSRLLLAPGMRIVRGRSHVESADGSSLRLLTKEQARDMMVAHHRKVVKDVAVHNRGGLRRVCCGWGARS
jgi:hypothetical protein